MELRPLCWTKAPPGSCGPGHNPLAHGHRAITGRAGARQSIRVISTPCGARELKLNNVIEIVSLNQFPTAIRSIRERWIELGERIEKAKDYAITQYDWAIIAGNFINELEKRETLSFLVKHLCSLLIFWPLR